MNRRKGEVYGDLTVVRNLGNGSYWCKCICGYEKRYFLGNLKRGKSSSCGCKRDKKAGDKIKTHGKTNTRLYSTWTNIKSRCYNPKSTGFKNYGGRGIRMYDEWRENFSRFSEWSQSNGYEENLTIERIDVNKGYYPDNCEWIEFKYQSGNRRGNRMIEIEGETKTLSDWCRTLGHNYKTVHSRISRGASELEALDYE